MLWHKKSLLVSLFLLVLAGCGSSGGGEVVSFSERIWQVPEGYVFEKVTAEDIGDSVQIAQGYVSEDDEKKSSIVITTLNRSFLDSDTLRDASLASSQRLIGFDLLDTDKKGIECGESEQSVSTSRFSFLRSPLSEETYYSAQVYLTNGPKSVIISFISRDKNSAKSFLDETKSLTCS